MSSALRDALLLLDWRLQLAIATQNHADCISCRHVEEQVNTYVTLKAMSD